MNSYLGFVALTAKIEDGSAVLRWLFVKQHSVRDKIPEKPVDRTLFVINIPPFCNETSLAQTFSVCGKVRDVFCHPSPNPFLPPQKNSIFSKHGKFNAYKVAYVVFDSPKGLLKALSWGTTPLILYQAGVKTGIEKWMEEYNNNIIDHSEMQTEIDKFMSEFDAEEKRKEHEAKMAGEADEEGWIMVTSKSRKPGIARTEAARKKILDSEKVKRSRKELKNFYRFQIRESKMKHLETLRKKFEEDKKKVNAFKQSRKFKPF